MDTSPRILVVDDDRDIRTLLTEYLDANGFRTLTAADGAGMRKLLDTSKVDLVVLDLTLPGEDGLRPVRGRWRDSGSNAPDRPPAPHARGSL